MTAKTKIRADLTSAKATRKGYEEKIAKLSASLGFISDATAQATITNQISEASQEIQVDPIYYKVRKQYGSRHSP